MIQKGIHIMNESVTSNTNYIRITDDYCNALGKIFGTSAEKKELKPKKVIFNDPATIIYWNDDTKTVVKKMEGEPFIPYYGFCIACAKKIMGGNWAIRKEIAKYLPEDMKNAETDR